MSKTRVLLIEDNPGDAHLVRLYLEEADPAGFEVEVADRLNTAIERLGENDYDIILLDLSLPDSDGIETLNSILDVGLGIPVVVLTGYDDALIGSAAVQSGALDYLVKKDVNPGTLSRVIRYSIERYNTGRELIETRLSIEGLRGQVEQSARTIMDCVQLLVDAGAAGDDNRTRLVERIRSTSSTLLDAADSATADPNDSDSPGSAAA